MVSYVKRSETACMVIKLLHNSILGTIEFMDFSEAAWSYWNAPKIHEHNCATRFYSLSSASYM